MNIFELMMIDSDWRLCARLAGSPSPVYLVAKIGNTSHYFVYVIPAPGQLPVQVGTAAVPSTHPHFPYGFSVLPD